MKPSRYRIREFFYKHFFQFIDFIKSLREVLKSLAVYSFALASILFVCLLLFDLGFKSSLTDHEALREGYLILLTTLFGGKLLTEIFQTKFKKWGLVLSKAALLLFVFIVLMINFERINIQNPTVVRVVTSTYALILSSVMMILSETYRLSDFLNKVNIPPWLLFAGSFMIIILVGSGLLMMPNATTQPLSYLEALFTSTSAVCVTGLIVVDTSSAFTATGKGILLVLIQIGGLGIMAFTAFFSYAFTGSASLRQRFMLKDLISAEQLGGMFRLLGRILFLMVLIELTGVILLYYSVNGEWLNRLSFSVFHAVSAFCNAGFSTLSSGLTDYTVHNNRFMQMTISALVIFGGLGFPVLLIFHNSIIKRIKNVIRKYTGAKRETRLFPFHVNQNLAIKTSIILLILGTVFYYFFERNASMNGVDNTTQWLTAFFGSTSARTAGFNIADLSKWTYPTLFMMLFLMWVGASPGSTGGGIKTTTFALALRATYNHLRGRKYLEIENREIGTPTIVRVLSIIIVSVFVIFIGFFLMLSFEPGKDPVHLLFESVSAFSTVGLSVADTATLSVNSKIVLIFLMFIGRIGPVILLSGILASRNERNYRLPVENIAIN